MPYYYTQQDGEGIPNQTGNRPYDFKGQAYMLGGEGGFIGPGLGPGGGGRGWRGLSQYNTGYTGAALDPESRTQNAGGLAARYGFQPGYINPNDPDAAMGQILRGENDFRNRLYGPLEDQMIASLGDGKIVQTARDAAQSAMGGAGKRANRMASRYGGLTAFQQSEVDRKAKMGDASATAGLINNARIDQNQRDTEVRQGLVNYFRGVQGNAMGGLGEAANSQVSRQNAVSQAQSARRANTIGTVGSLAATALMLAFI